MQVADVMIAGRPMSVAGHAEDSFFAHAAEHAAGLAPLRAVAAAAVPADGVILDIGANIGLSALAFAGLVPAGRILAVEPSPRSLAALRETLRLNGLAGRVAVAPVALADAPGTLAFHEAEHSAGAHLLDPNMLAGIVGAQVTVPVTTLDALVAEHALPALHFVKIDVEGFETEVMAGASATFARHRPVVFAEFNAWVLQALRNANPRATLEGWMARFPVVHAMRQGRAPWRLTPENLLDFLHDHLVVRGCADDLVLSWDDAWLPRYQVPD
jgi:FkbM family methyltransferase